MTQPDRSRRSPLSGRYLVRNPAWNAALRLTDAILARVAQVERGRSAAAPSKILIAVGGHLGDAVIATSVLPILARTYPNAAIGMLLPSWSRAVVDGHPRLRWIHHADHWKMSRAGTGRAGKWRSYKSSAARAVDEIAAVGYDAAIDLYAYYPNASWLLWRAGIPVRIGYTSGGCGPLYTHSVEWRADLGHTAAQHAELLRVATAVIPNEVRNLLSPDVDERSLVALAPYASHQGRPRDDLESLGYDLPPISDEARTRARELAPHGSYTVIHPGTGDPKKAWPIASWRSLVNRLSAAGEHIVITGAGDDEERLAASLSGGQDKVQNLAGRLDWPSFRAVLADARIAIGPDSVAMHVAAAEGTPAIAIMAAMSDPEYWRPLGSRIAVLTRGVPCAPCFKKNGCQAMTCVRDVSVDDVLAAYEQLTVPTRETTIAGASVG
jgi:ADP-heptose:LPS heptosyltransferase